jgi:hypothetical protein
MKIQLLGEGAEYLWTKNALERNGFGISEVKEEISVALTKNSSGLRWRVIIKAVPTEANSIESVIKLLEQTIASERS